MPKQVEANSDGVINPQNYNILINFQQSKFWCYQNATNLSKSRMRVKMIFVLYIFESMSKIRLIFYLYFEQFFFSPFLLDRFNDNLISLDLH